MSYFKNAFLALLYFLLISFSWSAQSSEIILTIGASNYEQALDCGHFMVDNSELKDAILEKPEKIVSFYYPSTSGKSTNSSMLSYFLEKDGYIVLSTSWGFDPQDFPHALETRFVNLYETGFTLVDKNSSVENKTQILADLDSKLELFYQDTSSLEPNTALDELLSGLHLAFPDKKIVMIIDELNYALFKALIYSQKNKFHEIVLFRNTVLKNISSKVFKIITFGVNPIGLTDFLMENPRLMKISSPTSSSDLCQFFGTRRKHVKFLLEKKQFNSSYEDLKKYCLAYSYRDTDVFKTVSILTYFSHKQCHLDILEPKYPRGIINKILSKNKAALEVVLTLLDNNDNLTLRVEVSATFKYKDNFYENLTPPEALALLINSGVLYVKPESQQHIKNSIYSVEILPLNLELKCLHTTTIENIMWEKTKKNYNFSSEGNKQKVLSTIFAEM